MPQPSPALQEQPPVPQEPSAKVAGGESQNIDELVDQVADKVIAKLSEQTIQSIAWEVVPDLAETLIRKRIQELEEKIDD